MTTPTHKDWIDRLGELHPLLKARPAASKWAARQAEIDAAIKIDEEAARLARDDRVREKERRYNNRTSFWASFVIVVVVAILGIYVVFRLIEETQIENCLLAHRHNCDSLLDR
ncbi:MAG TPA: hypothetical protein VEJ16_00635 [Alphaproteobacteria bacterium]|nr:hypothetical protein [Alphaproteobacteria bacterium]